MYCDIFFLTGSGLCGRPATSETQSSAGTKQAGLSKQNWFRFVSMLYPQNVSFRIIVTGFVSISRSVSLRFIETEPHVLVSF